MAFSTSILLVASILHLSVSFDILLFPAFTRTNQIFFESIETELRLVGHEVKLLVFQENMGARALPPDAIIVPLQDDNIEGADANLRQWEQKALDDWSEEVARLPKAYTNAIQQQCVALLGHAKIVDVIRTHMRPNVLLVDLRFGACGLALGRLLNASVIGVQASPPLLRTDAPHAPFHIPSFMDRNDWTGFSFWDRATTALEHIIDNYRVGNVATAVCNLTPMCLKGDDLYNELSMVLVNGFSSWEALVQPVFPKLVYVGGLNFHTTALFPKDLEVVAREHRAGIILVTLVSSIPDDKFPDYIRNSLIGGFSRLPHAIFWKANFSNAVNLTTNIFLDSKFQSQNIMGHVRTRLVISFCDRDTVFVAIYHRMPLLCIPVLEDQIELSRRVEEQGIGVVLKLPQLNPDSLIVAVQSIVSNASFRERARYHATLLRDQPNTASDRLVFWTKYVILRKGARHLRNPAMKLHLTLPDIGVLLTCTVLVTALTVFATFRGFAAPKVERSKKPNKSKKKAE